MRMSPFVDGSAMRESRRVVRCARERADGRRRPPKNRSATTGAMSAWLSAPSGCSQVNIQLIMPNSSIVSGLCERGAASAPGAAAAIASANAGDDRALLVEHALAVGVVEELARPRSARGARACAPAYSSTKRAISCAQARLGRRARSALDLGDQRLAAARHGPRRSRPAAAYLSR